MIPYPQIDPVIIKVGPLALRWYGLMYLLGFLSAFFLVKKEIKEDYERGRIKDLQGELELLDGIILYLVIGVILGGRLGYVIFYNLPFFIKHPREIVATWHGGMSFHGGALGVLVAGYIFSKRHDTDFFSWADRFSITAPIGLGLGRLGNFINGELYGRITDVPWAMIFPQGGLVPRHPSQLYEAILEGPVLFSMLWPLRKKGWQSGKRLSVFFMSYGIIRFFVEFFREPDPQLGYIAFGWLTMGQLLSIAIFLLGMIIWVVRTRAQKEVLHAGH